MKAVVLLLEATVFAHWLFPPHVGTQGLSAIPALLFGSAFVALWFAILAIEEKEDGCL